MRRCKLGGRTGTSDESTLHNRQRMGCNDNQRMIPAPRTASKHGDRRRDGEREREEEEEEEEKEEVER